MIVQSQNFFFCLSSKIPSACASFVLINPITTRFLVVRRNLHLLCVNRREIISWKDDDDAKDSDDAAGEVRTAFHANHLPTPSCYLFHLKNYLHIYRYLLWYQFWVFFNYQRFVRRGPFGFCT